jgi:hypothetical protein
VTEQTPGPAPEPEATTSEAVPEAVPEAIPEAAPEGAAALPEHPAYSYSSSYPGWAAAPVAQPPRPKRRTALLAAGALVVCAALGGGYALLRRGGDGGPSAGHSAAPSAPATPAPSASYGVTEGGTHFGYLGQLLLPRGDDYEAGPDFEQYGDDTVFDAKKARAVLLDAEGGPHLGKAERKEVGAALDAMHIKGGALRTYRSADSGDQYLVMLTQVGNKLAAQRAPEDFRKFTKDSDFIRKGPAVPHYPHAVCVLPGAAVREADDRFDWFDTMYCEATEGDLVIRFQAEGTSPMERDQAARFLAEQLDRVKAPGESI